MNSKERSIAKDKAIDDTLAEVKEIKALLLQLMGEQNAGKSGESVKAGAKLQDKSKGKGG